MAKVRVRSFSLSARALTVTALVPRQNLANPLGVGAMALHEWALGTRTFQKMFGCETSPLRRL